MRDDAFEAQTKRPTQGKTRAQARRVMKTCRLKLTETRKVIISSLLAPQLQEGIYYNASCLGVSVLHHLHHYLKMKKLLL